MFLQWYMIHRARPQIQHRIGNTATTVIFPASDLMTELVNLYFARTNLYYPVLHRPTFEKSLADGLHLRDLGFGTVLLLVCAIGSRYSDDPHVLAPNEEPMRCGWKYFDQIHDTVNDLFARPSLYKLQYYAVRHPSASPLKPR